MYKFRTYLLWALVAWNLWTRSLAKDYVCLLDDPNSNQCDSFCLTALRPLLHQVVQAQNKGNALSVDIKAKLDKFVGQQVEMRGHLKAVRPNEETMETQLREMQTKMDEVHAKMDDVQDKLEGKLLTLQTKLEDRIEAVFTSQESLIRTVLLNIYEQQAVVGEMSDRVRNKAPVHYEQIGSRYFFIAHERQQWLSAARICRQNGGYLASIKNKEELTAISAKLNKSESYWLGINDLKRRGHYESVASKTTAPFLNFDNNNVNDINNILNCVTLLNGIMFKNLCTFFSYFICQADTET